MSLTKPVDPQLKLGTSYGCSTPDDVIYSIKIPYHLCKDWSEHAGNSVVAYHNLLNALLSDKQLALNPVIDSSNIKKSLEMCLNL
jgi:hypothetical protein